MAHQQYREIRQHHNHCFRILSSQHLAQAQTNAVALISGETSTVLLSYKFSCNAHKHIRHRQLWWTDSTNRMEVLRTACTLLDADAAVPGSRKNHKSFAFHFSFWDQPKRGHQ